MKPIPVKISPKNSKLGNIPNISTIPIKDCGNCEACRHDCYALKAWRQYPTTRAAWKHNSKAFRADVYAACDSVYQQLNQTINQPRFFRIHVAGDFLNQDHVNAWAGVAAKLPDIKFLAFTKMHDLDYSSIPENLQIVFSMFPLNKLPENGKIAKAWVKNDKSGNIETRIPDDAIECPGHCDTCGACWSLAQVGQDVYFENH